MKNTLIALFIMSTLTACSSRTTVKNTCYFMEGVGDSLDDEPRQSELKKNHDTHFALHIISGLFAILVSNVLGQEECPEKKTKGEFSKIIEPKKKG